MGNLSNVINNLSNITQGLETSRGCLYGKEKGKDLSDGKSVLDSYRSYMKSYQSMQKNNEKAEEERYKQNQIEPLSRLFDVINNKLEVFDVESNLEFGFAAVDWAIENKKTQQGFTALDETIKTWLCCHYNLNEFYEDYREGICKMICNLFSRRMQKEHIKAECFTEADREKIYNEWKDEWEKRQSDNKNNKKKHLGITMIFEEELDIAHQMAMELPCELAKLVEIISSRRNSMNHFGYSNLGEFGCEDLYKDLIKYYNKFKDLLKEIETNSAKKSMEK